MQSFNTSIKKSLIDQGNEKTPPEKKNTLYQTKNQRI